MAFACAFCGSTTRPRGREHVFPDWLTTIGLESSPVEYYVGWLNRTPRRWTSAPFTARVRAVCDTCNNGWMSELENAARLVLTSLILGESPELSADDQRLIAAWACKTAFVSLLSSAEEDRADGYGVPPEEYRALYATREHPEPLPYSQYWTGRYVGERPPGAIRVVPMVVELDGLAEPDTPAAYVLTLMVGALIVQGVRFTTPSLFVDLVTEPKLPVLWPTHEAVSWPPSARIDDPTFERMLLGKALRAVNPGIRLVPFKPATDLRPSRLEGSMLRQPVPCGKHDIFFPAILAHEAEQEGKRYSLMSSCECGIAYLLTLEADGAHFRRDGTPEYIGEAFEALEGDEYQLQDNNGIFFYKELS
jgi:hypothetical protein